MQHIYTISNHEYRTKATIWSESKRWLTGWIERTKTHKRSLQMKWEYMLILNAWCFAIMAQSVNVIIYVLWIHSIKSEAKKKHRRRRKKNKIMRLFLLLFACSFGTHGRRLVFDIDIHMEMVATSIFAYSNNMFFVAVFVFIVEQWIELMMEQKHSYNSLFLWFFLFSWLLLSSSSSARCFFLLWLLQFDL